MCAFVNKCVFAKMGCKRVSELIAGSSTSLAEVQSIWSNEKHIMEDVMKKNAMYKANVIILYMQKREFVVRKHGL